MSLKVIRIETNKQCTIVDWNPCGGKINGQNVDHESLMGLEDKGLKLGLFGLEWTKSSPPPEDMIKKWDVEAKNNYNTYNINKIAMKILKNLKYPGRCIDYPEPIKGPVLLYDDDTNMTKEKWDIIRKFINSKNN